MKNRNFRNFQPKKCQIVRLHLKFSTTASSNSFKIKFCIENDPQKTMQIIKNCISERTRPENATFSHTFCQNAPGLPLASCHQTFHRSASHHVIQTKRQQRHDQKAYPEQNMSLTKRHVWPDDGRQPTNPIVKHCAQRNDFILDEMSMNLKRGDWFPDELC